MMMSLAVVDAWWSEPQSDRIGAFVGLGVVLVYLFSMVMLIRLRRRGVGRCYAIWSNLALTIMSVLACILGLVIMFLDEQPSYVWERILGMGMACVFLFGIQVPLAMLAYRFFEQSRLDASILRSGASRTIMTSEGAS